MTATGTLVRARAAVEAGLAHNAAGRPARASGRFRSALRLLAATEGGFQDGGMPGGGSAGGGSAGSGSAGGEASPAYLRARALLGLVMSDFELRADLAASRAMLDAAERSARTAGAAAVEVAIHGQRGLLWLRGGDVDAALRELDRAVARVAQAEPVDACVLLLNRGTVHLERGHLARARVDLAGCAERAAAIGDVLLMFKARHNLGYLEFLAGDLPAALSAMDDAARIEHGGSPAVALLDQAQVLLEAGLTTEADATLGRAALLFSAHRLTHDLAEVELARAHCALLAGRPGEALRWAGSARRRFVRRGNTAWAARAELAGCRARLAALVDADPTDPAALVRLARQAESLGGRARARRGGGGRETGRVAMVTAAEAWVAAGRPGPARAALRAAGRLTGRESLSMAVQVRVVRASLAFAAGQPQEARRQVRAGQAMLAAHRRQLGSVAAVAAAAVHGARLSDADVGAALERGDPAAVLEAVERGRATFAGPARVRPPRDPGLAELLAELRQCLERERLVPPDGGAAALAERDALHREAARLRGLASERSWRLGDGTGAPPAPTSREVRAALHEPWPDGPPVLADYLVHRGAVHAVIVDRAGLRLVRLARIGQVDELARRLHADLQVLANPLLPPALRSVARSSLDRGLRGLDALLVEPVACDGPLHVVADGALVTLPWGLVPSRVGRATSVSTRLRPPASAGPPRPPDVVALAGPGLDHAEDEVIAVAQAWPVATALVGAAADCAAGRTALRTAGVVHLAAHGHHDADNPLFSWVRLADGPLFAHELEGATLDGAVVVLSACEVGRATVRPGGEVLGLASVLLRLGAGAVVAALAPLRDDVAAQVMPALHRQLTSGTSPASALAAACASAREPVPLACFAPTAVGTGARAAPPPATS